MKTSWRNSKKKKHLHRERKPTSKKIEIWHQLGGSGENQRGDGEASMAKPAA
jgi:hypothetical protein